MNHDEYHRKFADAIIEQIKKGTAPWQKPWAPGERVMPMNVDTERSYRGGNSLHLAAVQQETGHGDVRWGTYRQIQARGGQVRKGERGTRILSFQDKKRIAVTDERGSRSGTPRATASTATRSSRRRSCASTPCSTPSRPTGCPSARTRRPSRSGRPTSRPNRSWRTEAFRSATSRATAPTTT